MSYGSISAVSVACPHVSAVPYFCVLHLCFALVRVLALRLEDNWPVTVISSRKISYSIVLCPNTFAPVCCVEESSNYAN